MQTRRWVNQSQPQTLVIATFLLYATAVFVVLGQGPGIGAAIGGAHADQIENFGRLFVAAGGIYAGYSMANEQKTGYYLGIAVAALPLLAKLIDIARYHVSPLDSRYFDPINLMFEIAMLALLLHQQSRNYARIWFK